MKTLTAFIWSWATVAFFCFGITSCQQSEPTIDDPLGRTGIENNATAYARLMSERTNFKGYPFEILEVRKKDQLVTIVVEGSCDTKACIPNLHLQISNSSKVEDKIVDLHGNVTTRNKQ